MHYRKDSTRCNNNRTIRRTKLESKIIESLREIILDPKLLQEAAQKMNELVKEKLRIAPDEVARLSRRQDELQQEIANINRFIRHCESPPKSTIAELQQAEEEFERNKSKMDTLRAAKLDNLLVTPFTLRAKYEKLPKVLEENALAGNCALKDLFRNGLICTPTDYENRKSSNPLKNLWSISGTLFMGTEGRFYDYKNGGR